MHLYTNSGYSSRLLLSELWWWSCHSVLIEHQNNIGTRSPLKEKVSVTGLFIHFFLIYRDWSGRGDPRSVFDWTLLFYVQLHIFTTLIILYIIIDILWFFIPSMCNWTVKKFNLWVATKKAVLSHICIGEFDSVIYPSCLFSLNLQR